MGCGGYGIQTWTILIMSYNIVQILIHLISMILEVMIYNCQDILDFKSEQQQALYLAYYLNSKCVDGVVPDDYKSNYADRTEILAIDNVVLDIVWLIVTIIILSFICASHKTRSYFWAHVAWIVVGSIATIHDLASMILYIIDVIKAEDITYYFDFVPSSLYKDILKLPPIIMLIISSRLFLFFILNIIALIGMMVIASHANKNTSQKTKQRTVPLKPPKPVIKNARPSQLQEDNISRVEDWYKHYENNNNNAPDVVSNAIPRLNDRNYSPASSDSDQNRSQNSYNFSNGHSNMVGNNTNVMINGVPSGTLRRQLPWSYVHEPGILPQRQMRQKDMETPPVPVPDYSMRLRGNPRFDEPNWTQYPLAPAPVPPPRPHWRTPNNRY